MEKLTLPLALAEVLPILLAAGGFFYLARMIAYLSRDGGRLAFVGVGLLVAGGLCKACWSLLLLAGTTNLRTLDNLCPILLTPGVICLAWALWNAFRPVGQVPIWVIPVILMSVMEGAAAIRALSKGGAGWFLILLGGATVASLAAGLILLREAWQRRQGDLIFLFSFYLGAVVMQTSLVWLPRQTVALQWMTYGISLLAWGAFAFAAWQLSRLIIGPRS